MAVLLRRFRSAAVVTLLALFHLWPELALSLGRDEPVAGQEWRVASANLLFGNRDVDALRVWIERERPDVLALLELTRPWLPLLAELRASYPYQLVLPERDAFPPGTWGQAVISRVPFEAATSFAHDFPSFPDLEVVVRLAGRAVTIRAVHPPRPGKPERIRNRDRVLARLHALAWSDTDVLLGDFNLTSSSPRFAALLAAAGLRDSRRGFGRCTSWTNDRFVPGLEITIDHVLVGPRWCVLERRSDPLAGSDHRIAFARMVLRE